MIHLKIRHKQHPHINADKVVADESEKQAWLEAVAQGKFCGLPERWKPEIDCSEEEKLSALETRVVDGSRTEYKLPAEYVIEEVDLTNNYDYLLQQCHQNRLKEYPTLGDFADAYVKMQNGDSLAMQEYVDKCNQVKTKYPKP